MNVPRYAWQSFVFEGLTLQEATAAFDAWFGYGQDEYSISRQRIRRQADGSLHYHLTHCPQADGYALHVTALVEVAPPPPEEPG